VKGGTGFAKVGGNYACSLIGQQKAEKQGYAQVLWLDGLHHKYIDEVGAMNVFFKIKDEIITPSLEGSILPGVTRRSVIELLCDKGYKATERQISIDEVYEASLNGTLEEMFGTGTAAVISPVGELVWNDNHMIINNFEIGPVSGMLYKELTDIQWGVSEDKFNWTIEVK
ncbi:branched chain amino acid aminotransferase, partial [Candidatus Nomurabacteria bacterium]|nr:branched chain amino acid aminotransferase [Candidatus Nomurabacteria bacterium]